jgi:hypothetical protein
MGTCTIADIVHVIGGASETTRPSNLLFIFLRRINDGFQGPLASSWSHLGVATLETPSFAVGGGGKILSAIAISPTRQFTRSAYPFSTLISPLTQMG